MTLPETADTAAGCRLGGTDATRRLAHNASKAARKLVGFSQASTASSSMREASAATRDRNVPHVNGWPPLQPTSASAARGRAKTCATGVNTGLSGALTAWPE